MISMKNFLLILPYFVFMNFSALSFGAQTSSNNVTDFYLWRHGETDANKENLLSGGTPAMHTDFESWSAKTSLNEEGKRQAIELGSIVVNQCSLTVIYTSDLSRAYETATAVVDAYQLQGRSIPLRTNVQLREILHGKYELTSAKVRNEAGRQKLNELLESPVAPNDKFTAWKIHPLANSDEVVDGDCIDNDVIDVEKYLSKREANPETPWQLFHRIKNELAKIAREHPQETIGISTHGGVLATLLESLTPEFKGTYLPPHYNGTEIKVGDKVIPAAIKVKNCALIHLQFHHESGEFTYVDE